MNGAKKIGKMANQLSSSNLVTRKKNCPEIEKYLQRLKKINLNDKDTQNSLKHTIEILERDENISKSFKATKESISSLKSDIPHAQNHPDLNRFNNNIDTFPNTPEFQEDGKSKINIYTTLEKLLNNPLMERTSEISELSSIFSRNYIKSAFEKAYFSQIEKLNDSISSRISNLENILFNYKTIEEDHAKIISNIISKEDDIDSMLNFKSDFFNNNKNFIIRNEILKNFLDKVMITKEEKDNLLKKNLFDEKFFKLIKKLFEIKYFIKVLERNSENFSKNLIFSIKENFGIMDDLLNEKIIIYIKDMLRSSERFFANKNFFSNNQKSFYNNLYQEFLKEFDIDNWLIALSYISEKENYKNFIIKEYVNSRKKIIENILKQKYLKLNKIDLIFENLISDAKIFFLKEFLLFQVFFGNSLEGEISLVSCSKNKITIAQENKSANNNLKESASNNFDTNISTNNIEILESENIKMESINNCQKNYYADENLLNLNKKEKKILFDFYFNNFLFAISEEEIQQSEELKNITLQKQANNNNVYDVKEKELNNFVLVLLENLSYISKKLRPKFSDNHFSLSYLNQILYILEEIYYENLKYLKTAKNLEKDLNENYKLLLLSDYFQHNIEEFFKADKLSLFDFPGKLKNNQINFFSLNNSYKKEFSNNSVKLFNESYKFLQKINRAAFELLFEEENTLNNPNTENSLIKSYYQYMDDYFRLFADYRHYKINLLQIFSKYGPPSSPNSNTTISNSSIVSKKDRNVTSNRSDNINCNIHTACMFENKQVQQFYSSISPKNQNAFKLLIEFFNQDVFKKEQNKNLILRTLNLLNTFLNKYKIFEEFLDDELNSITSQINYFKALISDIYFKRILQLSEFENNLHKIISHEQAINLIQLILEKSKIFFNVFYFFRPSCFL